MCFDFQEIDIRLSNFCFLDIDSLLIRESHASCRRSTEKYAVKPPRPEGDMRTIDPYHCRNNGILFFFKSLTILLASPAGFEPTRQRYLASQKPIHIQNIRFYGELMIVKVKTLVFCENFISTETFK